MKTETKGGVRGWAAGVAGVALALTLAPRAGAQTTLTFNVANGDWHAAANWEPQQVPTTNDTAQINSSRTATIGSGHDAEAGQVRVGYGSTGTLNVNGNLTTTGNVELGISGSGTLNQSDNSAVTVGASLTLSGVDGGSGICSLGANTTLDVGSINVVRGSFTVPETSTFTLGSDLNIAYGTGNYQTPKAGTFTYNNTSVALNVPGNLTLGYSDYWASTSSGTFNQSANTTVTVAGVFNIGAGGHGTGIYNQGTNTSLTVGRINVFRGAFTVLETSDFSLGSDLNIAWGNAGYQTPKTGTFSYSKTADALNVPGNLNIGFSDYWASASSGTFNQSDNTTVTVGGSLNLGIGVAGSFTYTQGSNTTLTVGSSVTINNGTFTVPETFRFSLGSDLNIVWGVVAGGYQSSHYGTFTYRNPSVALNIPGNLNIGNSTYWAASSIGTFNQSNNTAVTVGGALNLGANSYGSGFYDLGSGATLTVNGAATIATAGGSGKLNINGGTATFVGQLTVGAGGQLNINGGALHLPRQTTTSGTFAHTAGSLHFGIGGDPASGAFDKVTVNGGVMTLAGELQVDLEGGYKPELTNSYAIVTRTGGALWGTFANAPVSGGRYRLGGMEAMVTYGADSVVLSEWREAPDGILLIVR